MKLEIDRPRCEGHGLCEDAAPDLLHLDDLAEVVIDISDIGEDELERARAAVRVCPVAALRLV